MSNYLNTKSATTAALLAFGVLAMYIVAMLLEFYGVEVGQFGSYFLFYAFLAMSCFILPSPEAP